MKKLLVAALLIPLSIGSVSAQTPDTLEYKIAVIDAGKYVQPSDSSIPRAKLLVSGISKCYRVSQQEAGDMSVKAWDVAKKDGHPFSVLDIMDAALIACDGKSSKAALSEALAQYVSVRSSSGQTHHQAVHGLLIVNYAAKRTR